MAVARKVHHHQDKLLSKQALINSTQKLLSRHPADQASCSQITGHSCKAWYFLDISYQGQLPSNHAAFSSHRASIKAGFPWISRPKGLRFGGKSHILINGFSGSLSSSRSAKGHQLCLLKRHFDWDEAAEVNRQQRKPGKKMTTTTIALWSRTTKNPDESTVRSLIHLICSHLLIAH